MLGSITPLGERGRRSKWGITMTAFLTGSAGGGAAVGAVLGLVGEMLRRPWGTGSTRLWVLAGVIALGVAMDVRAAGMGLPTVHRQVNEDWLHRYRYLALYDTTTGKLIRRLDLPDRVGAITFSPDSRMLAWGGWGDPSIHFVEVATGRERHALRGHKGRILSLTFSADARMLVSGSEDTTAPVWDLAGPLGGPHKETKPPTLAELEAAWADLAAGDTVRAYRALRRLGSAPAEAVPHLRKHLRPVAVIDEKHLARLIADLDSSRFVVRERAARELEGLGSAAEWASRYADRVPPSSARAKAPTPPTRYNPHSRYARHSRNGARRRITLSVE